MNRLSVHSVFFIVVIVLASYIIWQFQTLNNQIKLNDALAAIPNSVSASDPIPAMIESSDQVRLAWANALSAGGELDAAEKLYAELINRLPEDDIGNAAEYNLGNTYLREGTNMKNSGNRRRALLGLAKERYRDLLKRTPEDWDARYNLERALRLAPEVAGLRDAKGPPIKSVDVVVPDFMLKALP